MQKWPRNSAWAWRLTDDESASTIRSPHARTHPRPASTWASLLIWKNVAGGEVIETIMMITMAVAGEEAIVTVTGAVTVDHLLRTHDEVAVAMSGRGHAHIHQDDTNP